MVRVRAHVYKEYAKHNSYWAFRVFEINESDPYMPYRTISLGSAHTWRRAFDTAFTRVNTELSKRG